MKKIKKKVKNVEKDLYMLYYKLIKLQIWLPFKICNVVISLIFAAELQIIYAQGCKACII